MLEYSTNASHDIHVDVNSTAVLVQHDKRATLVGRFGSTGLTTGLTSTATTTSTTTTASVE